MARRASSSMNAVNQRIRASDVDWREGPATFIENPMRDMANFESLYEQHPGRAPGGSGTTGLQSRDARGHSDMLNEQIRYMRLRAMMGGKEAPEVRADPRSNFRSAFAPMDQYAKPNYGFGGATDVYGRGSALGALKERATRRPTAGGY